MKTRFFFVSFFFLCYAYNLSSQAGMWTWVKGSNTGNPAGNFGTQGVEATSNTPPGLYEPYSWTDTSGNFWLYGGVDSTNLVWGDLWKFNPTTNNWTWMKGTGQAGAAGVWGTLGVPSINNTPGYRGYAAATWVDKNGDMWLYGGCSYFSQFGVWGDMWRYNIATNTWTWMQGSSSGNVFPKYSPMGVETDTGTPGSRYKCEANWVDSSNNLWLYGGLWTGYNTDLWKYNTTTNRWTWVAGTKAQDTSAIYGAEGVPSPTNAPSSRSVYSAWTDANQNFWMYGGLNLIPDSSHPTSYNDMWRYQPSTDQWTWTAGTNTRGSTGNYGTQCTSDTGLSSSQRFDNHAIWKDGCGNFWFYGGEGWVNGTFALTYNNDLWSFNPVSLKWTLANGSAASDVAPVYGTIGTAAPNNNPGGRGGAVSWSSKSGELYLFGGEVNGLKTYNDIWEFTIDPSCGSLNAGSFTLQTDTGLASCGQSNGSVWAIVSAGASPYTYHWNTGSSNDTLSNLSPGVYDVTVTDFLGCSVSTVAIVDSSLSANVIISEGDTTFCSGNSTSICAPNGFTSYQWNNGASTACITATQAGNYYVSVTASGGCSATSNRININVLSTPPVSISINGDTLSAFDAVTYQWYFNGNLLQGDTNSVLVANQPGAYSVAVSDSNGCPILSNNVNITGINNVIDVNSISVYPDPAFDELNISYTLKTSANLQIVITDVTGRSVFNVCSEKEMVRSYIKQIDIHSLAPAIYILKLTAGNVDNYIKFIKE